MSSSENNIFDVAVIGGGPGGYVAAIRAAQLGLKTLVLEREHLGGVCLNWGCIPTKALLRSSEIYHLIKHSKEFGIKCKEVTFDMSAIVKRSRNVAKQLNNGVKSLMKANNISVIDGHAMIGNENIITVHKYSNREIGEKIAEVKAKNIILATGARARELPSLKIDNKRVLGYTAAMTQESLPKSVLVVGGGAIGVEFASFYLTMGSKVTLIEVAERILSTEDKEISNLAAKDFSQQGMQIYTKAKLVKIKEDSAIIEHGGKEIEVECEKIISAVGVLPNTENIGIENSKIKLLPSGHIETDEYGETAQKGIYAIGDITKPPYLAHKASHDGVSCAENIIQKTHKLAESSLIPGCIYSHPEIASIGLSEDEAKSQGLKVNVGKFPMIGNGKAIATGLGAEKGLIKIISDKDTGEIFGAHMIGHGVTEMIHSVALAKKAELTDQDFINTIFPHPTISESLHEASLASLGKEIHMPPKK